MNEELWTIATLITTWVFQLLNSNFITALAGAFAGAYAAQYIVERSDRKRRLLEESRNTNAAINEAFHIMNVLCTVKQQLIAPMLRRYDNEREIFEKAVSSGNQKPITTAEAYSVDVDFQSLPQIPASTQTLRRLLFDKVSAQGRPLSLLAYLAVSIDDTNNAIRTRNETINRYRARSARADADVVTMYFGLPNRDGHIDTFYPDTMNSLSHNIDNAIFFSKTLVEDLMEHGRRISKALGRRSPQVHKVDLTKAEQAGLIPDSALYEDWLRMHTF